MIEKLEQLERNKIVFYIVSFIIYAFLYILIVLLPIYYSDYTKLYLAIKIIFIIFSSVFFILFFIFFVRGINSDYPIEFYLSLGVLSLILLGNIIKTALYQNLVYKLLNQHSFTTLTLNCFDKSDLNESFNNEYETNYLKTNGTIPIAFYNKKLDTYQDLILADFYYPCSYYSYLADSPLNGTPNIDALKIALSDFKVRFVHLDIFSDSNDQYDPNANPVVRCENMSKGATPLNLEECFGLINKWAWITDDKNTVSYPFFLYLNFNFNENNEAIYLKIYNSLIKFFSKYFIDKKYGFSGRNSSFSVSEALMKECLGKIIIITNRYPTKCALDELINTSTNSLNKHFNLVEYKGDYIKFDKLGISQDYNKNTLINQCSKNINFCYTNPNTQFKNDDQVKAGLFNPNFQDCAQYGIQGTLMYLFIPDSNLQNWNLFFKTKNNLDPVLKDEKLRFTIKNKNEIIPQNPVIGLQTPQKYCVIPGMISTYKSNISANSTNNSCN
jgi:hypothetical protein